VGTTEDWGNVLKVFNPVAVCDVDRVITSPGGGYGEGGNGKKPLISANKELYF
jgi:hypothetical protein